MNSKVVALFLVVVCCFLSWNQASAGIGPQCLLPLEVGPCKADMQRYGYNPETNQCELFSYGGCDGNTNNFRTLQECHEICSSSNILGDNGVHLECFMSTFTELTDDEIINYEFGKEKTFLHLTIGKKTLLFYCNLSDQRNGYIRYRRCYAGRICPTTSEPRPGPPSSTRGAERTLNVGSIYRRLLSNAIPSNTCPTRDRSATLDALLSSTLNFNFPTMIAAQLGRQSARGIPARAKLARLKRDNLYGGASRWRHVASCGGDIDPGYWSTSEEQAMVPGNSYLSLMTVFWRNTTDVKLQSQNTSQRAMAVKSWGGKNQQHRPLRAEQKLLDSERRDAQAETTFQNATNQNAKLQGSEEESSKDNVHDVLRSIARNVPFLPFYLENLCREDKFSPGNYASLRKQLLEEELLTSFQRYRLVVFAYQLELGHFRDHSTSKINYLVRIVLLDFE
ncbi:Kunitz-type proteinase inhibitor kalicludin-1 [Melipona quadrifasciata]|uniref:Kunitz-type proteinase inhibitor kalicludin-1 n=1 Tax=Melipona quadrifasciata TaxID=166423 RepID=A0A0N0BE26_9HYME|nr:Kunitz-type proteinase inhibitor kalicludin-1 [Melipona quadrifasciata]